MRNNILPVQPIELNHELNRQKPSQQKRRIVRFFDVIGAAISAAEENSHKAAPATPADAKKTSRPIIGGSLLINRVNTHNLSTTPLRLYW